MVVLTLSDPKIAPSIATSVNQGFRIALHIVTDNQNIEIPGKHGRQDAVQDSSGKPVTFAYADFD